MDIKKIAFTGKIYLISNLLLYYVKKYIEFNYHFIVINEKPFVVLNCILIKESDST